MLLALSNLALIKHTNIEVDFWNNDKEMLKVNISYNHIGFF